MENEKSDWNEEYPEDWIHKLRYAAAIREAELDEESSIASLYIEVREL
jgi:hypothetical protein